VTIYWASFPAATDPQAEFLAADALAQGADPLITCGAPQSQSLPHHPLSRVKEGSSAAS